MAVSIGGLRRLIAIGLIAAAAACSPVERPVTSAPTAALPPPPAADAAAKAPAGTTTTTPAPAPANAPPAPPGTTGAPTQKNPLIPISIAPGTGTPGAMRYAMEDD